MNFRRPLFSGNSQVVDKCCVSCGERRNFFIVPGKAQRMRDDLYLAGEIFLKLRDRDHVQKSWR